MRSSAPPPNFDMFHFSTLWIGGESSGVCRRATGLGLHEQPQHLPGRFWHSDRYHSPVILDQCCIIVVLPQHREQLVNVVRILQDSGGYHGKLITMLPLHLLV